MSNAWDEFKRVNAARLDALSKELDGEPYSGTLSVDGKITRAIEQIEGLRRDEKKAFTDQHFHHTQGWNDALDDVIAILKGE
jgi:hypothetical protein